MGFVDSYWFSKGKLENKYREMNIENMDYMRRLEELDPYIETFYNDLAQYCNQSFCHQEKENKDFPFFRSFICPNYSLYQEQFVIEDNNENLFDQIVHDAREFLWLNNKNKENNNIYTQGLCVYTSLHILSRLKNIEGVEAYLIHTYKTLGIPANYHAFIFARTKNKNYIIDCTYSQFLSLYYSSLDALKVLPCLNAMPAYFLTTDNEKKQFLDQILTKGWFEANEENINMYLDSFVLASRNAYYYLNHKEENMIDIEKPQVDYLEVINSFINYTKAKNMGIDDYFDVYYAREKGLSYGKEQELTYQVDGLTDKQANDLNQNIKENKMLIKTRRKIEKS